MGRAEQRKEGGLSTLLTPVAASAVVIAFIVVAIVVITPAMASSGAVGA